LQGRFSAGDALFSTPAIAGTSQPLAPQAMAGPEAPTVASPGYLAFLSGGGGDEDDVWSWLRESWPWVNDKVPRLSNQEPPPPGDQRTWNT
jgi:hypothetical protein